MAKKGSKKVSSTPSPKPDSLPNGKKSKKGKKNEIVEESKDDRKSKQQANRAKVTSTASWTGKLPHTLLHEFCQKKKWNKVEYDMKKFGDKGLIAIAVLSYTDPKTKEVITVRMNDPTYDKINNKGLLVPQETPMEARHMAATLALCRIAYNTNLHMMLPPNHKQLWYYLDDFRKGLIKSNSTKASRTFDSEPFKTIFEDRVAKAKREKELAARDNQSEKESKMPIVISSSTLAETNKVKKQTNTRPSSSKPKQNCAANFPRKVWENATFIDLAESSRQIIEISMRKYIDWTAKGNKIDRDGDKAKELEEKLLSLNFRRAHVKEAMKYEDPLSFLLFNLPEDDLPQFFHKRKEDSRNKIEISSLPLQTRMMVERLVESGFSNDEVLYALEKTDMDENEAAGFLTRSVLPELQDLPGLTDSQESIEIWNQEYESLKSIYEDKVELVKKDCSFTIALDDKLRLKLKVLRTKNYPFGLPGIIVSTFDRNYKLPNYIKKQILSKLLLHIKELSLLGDMFVFHIYEWLQENFKKVIDNPGPLVIGTSTASTGLDDVANTSTQQSTKKNKTTKSSRLLPSQLDEVRKKYFERLQGQNYKEMQLVRAALPAWNKQELIVDLIDRNDVVLITGETGSGKSTQVVQFLLDSLYKQNKWSRIVCTQPRRISAIGLAERVSDERCVKCGDEVGYVIRGVNKTTPFTRITFMTTGVLVRMLRSDRNSLENTIIVLDEVHERSIDTDLVVTLLRRFVGKVEGLKVVLMSATISVDLFKKFFPGLATCHIEGRTFPIKDYYLEDILGTLDFKIAKNNKNHFYNDGEDIDNSDDGYLRPSADSKFFRAGNINYDLICQLTKHVDGRLESEKNDGSIIIFLPGVAEINKCCRLLSEEDAQKQLVVLPLHSALTPEDQQRVFKKYPGYRKIVVSTNIAETSITIDDCVATIDTGRAKTTYYNSHDNTTRLIESFISKAEAKQRRGRAGRVREGVSFKLFSRSLYEEFAPMPAPEIKRISLESLYLSVKALNIGDVTKFLASGLEAPPLNALQKAERMLIAAGLLHESDKSLTELGRYISLMPVMDSKYGKLLIYSVTFGVTDIGILVTSILSTGSLPFVGGIENRDAIKRVLSRFESEGDVLAVTELLQKYLTLKKGQEKSKFLKDNMLSYNKVNDILSARVQYYSILKDVGFLPNSYKPGAETFNRNAHNFALIMAVLTGAFYPHVARVQLPDPKFLATTSGTIEKDPEAKLIKYWIRNEEYQDRLISLFQDNQELHDIKNLKNLPLPASRAFIHPSSVFFSNNNINPEDFKTLDDDSIMKEKYTSSTPMLKFPFIIFNSSQVTNKLYLRDITPTSTLAVLLFGGAINYDINGTSHSPGIVVDNWLPIRTWCKNAVLIKELRKMLDLAIKVKFDMPSYADDSKAYKTQKADDVLKIVEELLCNER
ncbi:hypothetical protein KAFR_0A05780 [Kazachstania africana CBS 2517]|uniref:RNA helicase n=1 Tax=Kazachstania africana (strain ATCC 22294 / BCRC 22015 / CBS 2517 / CECT 1963 / NBRC 1671 / NRRL Y-8276) TaxID=1071382 RepID=H2ANR3_KAZAF|nr:hypothetical protein KAFR_0A05780 [Kazachstania africana CBS 2517]CCF56013.1 hypothetical protein KAFR_0A05780 [Kazachstania africana CBS 2517]